jgi:hypothetical protein
MFAPPIKATKSKAESHACPVRAPNMSRDIFLQPRLGAAEQMLMLTVQRIIGNQAESLTGNKSDDHHTQEANPAPMAGRDYSNVTTLSSGQAGQPEAPFAPRPKSVQQPRYPMRNVQLLSKAAHLPSIGSNQEPQVVSKATPFEGDIAPEWDVRAQENLKGRAVKAVRRPGTPLPLEVQRDAALRFGHDFTHVRVHTDEQASKAAASLQASAFTLGSNIVFGANRYAPASPQGRLLLQHELRHVDQQRQASNISTPEIDSPHSLHEQEARRLLDPHVEPLSVQRIQRAPEEAQFSLGDGMVDSVGKSAFGDSAWPFIKAVFEGFVGGLQADVKSGRADEAKGHLSKILMPWNAVKFYGGYVVGLAIGLVSPITDLVKGIIGVVKLGISALDWLAKWSPVGVAVSRERQQKITALMQKFSDLSTEFGRSLSDFIMDPSGTVKKFAGFLDNLMQLALGKSRELGATAAHSIFDFLKKEFFDMGKSIGEVIGALTAQVLLLVFSQAIGNMISKGASFVGKAAEFVAGKAVEVFEWVKGLVREVVALLRNAVKSALKLFEGLVNKATEAFEALAALFSESAVLELGGEKVAVGVGRGVAGPAPNIMESRIISSGRTSPATVADLKPPRVHPSNVVEPPKRPALGEGKYDFDAPLSEAERKLTPEQLRQKHILEESARPQEAVSSYTERELKTSQPGRGKVASGMGAKPKHHVFPQEERPFFEKRGFKGKYDIDKFTVELEQSHHEAIHPDWRLGQTTPFEWNRRVMSELVSTESKIQRELSRREITDIVEKLMKDYRIPKKYVPFKG